MAKLAIISAAAYRTEVPQAVMPLKGHAIWKWLNKFIICLNTRAKTAFKTLHKFKHVLTLYNQTRVI